MRMWMTDPKYMCRQHLIAEHNECFHMGIGILKRKNKIDGFIAHNCLEISSMKSRHDELVEEMIKRGYKHNTPSFDIPEDILDFYKDYLDIKVNVEQSERLLRVRCPNCNNLFKERDEATNSLSHM